MQWQGGLVHQAAARGAETCSPRMPLPLLAILLCAWKQAKREGRTGQWREGRRGAAGLGRHGHTHRGVYQLGIVSSRAHCDSRAAPGGPRGQRPGLGEGGGGEHGVHSLARAGGGIATANVVAEPNARAGGRRGLGFSEKWVLRMNPGSIGVKWGTLGFRLCRGSTQCWVLGTLSAGAGPRTARATSLPAWLAASPAQPPLPTCPHPRPPGPRPPQLMRVLETPGYGSPPAGPAPGGC